MDNISSRAAGSSTCARLMRPGVFEGGVISTVATYTPAHRSNTALTVRNNKLNLYELSL